MTSSSFHTPDEALRARVERVVRGVILDCSGRTAHPGHDERLIENGYLDSYSVASLIAELQDELGAEFEHADLTADNFGTIRDITRLVARSMMVRA